MAGIFFANLAAGHTALCSGTLHKDLGPLSAEDMTDQALMHKLGKLAVRYPYGGSVNQCRKENISQLLCNANLPV